MDLNKFNILQEKILQKLNEDASLFKDDGFRDQSEKAPDTILQSLNTKQAIAKDKKEDARATLNIIKNNPEATEDSIRYADIDYKRKINRETEIKAQKQKIKLSRAFREDFDSIVKDLDYDLQEAAQQQIEFANKQIEDVNNKINIVKSDTKKKIADLNKEQKIDSQEQSDVGYSKIQQLKDANAKEEERLRKQSEKQEEAIEKQEELKLKTLERRLMKLKTAKSNLKSENSTTTDTSVNTSSNISNEELIMEKNEYEQYLEEKEQLEEGIINAVRKLKRQSADKKLDKVLKKMGKLDLKIAEVNTKIENTKNDSYREVLNNKLSKLLEKKEQLEALRKKHTETFNDMDVKIKEDYIEENDNVILKEVAAVIAETDEVLQQIAAEESKLFEEREKLISPIARKIVSEGTTDLFLKPIVQSLKEEIEKTNPDKRKIDSLVIKYGQMKK